jgi:hypothetical protein
MNLRIQPAGWAFAIWGFIYLLLMIFVVYQALPLSWVTSRNDKLIFEDIGYMFAANMLLNCIWLMIFRLRTPVTFHFSTIEISILLASCVFIMMKTTRTENLNWTEYITLKVGFSIYAGWVTAATILNACFSLKTSGIADPDYDEEAIGVKILWVAFIVYVAATVSEKNPYFGLVFIWATLAIRNNGKVKGFDEVYKTCFQILIVYGTFLGAFTGYLTMQNFINK